MEKVAMFEAIPDLSQTRLDRSTFMPRIAFDQAVPQQSSGAARLDSKEAAKRSVERVSHELEKVFANVGKTDRAARSR